MGASKTNEEVMKFAKKKLLKDIAASLFRKEI
jgi:hypothetical protein